MNIYCILFQISGYSNSYLFSFGVYPDSKNSSFRSIFFDQTWLGLDRAFLTNGLSDPRVEHYFNFMQKVLKYEHFFRIKSKKSFCQVAVLFGASPEMAALDLQDALKFEIKLAQITRPREERRDASRM